jgi:pyrimidine-nucleoside phosphorylase
MDINALDIGKAAMRLGAGRETKEDDVLLDVGVDLHQKIGSHVKKGDVLATLYVRDKGIEEAKNLILHAITIGHEQKSLKLIKQTIK